MWMMTKKYKKQLVLYFLILLCIVIVTPIGLNFLVIAFIPEAFAGNATSLILSFSIFIAAVIGGIISGWITLIGIRSIRESQKSETFIALYPQRKIAFHRIEEKMKVMIALVDRSEEELAETAFDYIKAELKRYMIDFQVCLEDSVIIGGEVYTDVQQFDSHFKRMVDFMSPNLSPADEKLFVGTYVLLESQREFQVSLDQLRVSYNEVQTKRRALDELYQKWTYGKED